MKKLYSFNKLGNKFIMICLLIILLLNGKLLIAQTYQSFPDGNAVWSEHYSPALNSSDTAYYYSNIIAKIDTSINGEIYHQLFLSYSDTSYSSILNSIYFGGIREDNKQVFFIPKDSLNEYLIYDFSKNIGDTIMYPYHNFAVSVLNYGWGSQDYLVISDIDSIQVYNGTFRKRYYFFLLDSLQAIDSYWIEGIGNNHGLLWPITIFPTNGENNKLVCLHYNKLLIYYNTVFSNCYPDFQQINYIHQENIITVFPNPCTNKINIKLYYDIAPYKICIYNIYGEVVYTTNINQSKLFSIDTREFSKGQYVLNVFGDDINYNKCFIVQ